MNHIAALEACVSKLPANKASFANDLLNKSKRYTLTEKQLFWVKKLVEIANKETDGEIVSVGDFSSVIEMFDRAKEKLKAPSIVLAHGERTVSLKLAGSQARVPGSLNVIIDHEEWAGRIHRDGHFEVSSKWKDETGVVTLLKAFAANPAEGAKESARLTGRCCFCNTGIRDPRSITVGYGPICAKRFGLPH